MGEVCEMMQHSPIQLTLYAFFLHLKVKELESGGTICPRQREKAFSRVFAAEKTAANEEGEEKKKKTKKEKKEQK